MSGVLTDPEQGGGSAGNAEAVERVAHLRDALHEVQREFLRIEKFANLNTTACYKILKKHDKLIPATVCCRYGWSCFTASRGSTRTTARCLWCRCRTLFEKLRPRRAQQASKAQGNGPKGGPGAQDFVRTTRKYWVATEDVSTVKQAIAEHPPVFLMEREKAGKNIVDLGEEMVSSPGPEVASDSQMTSSVYLDNVNLGLYHTRLQKQPHSICHQAALVRAGSHRRRGLCRAQDAQGVMDWGREREGAIHTAARPRGSLPHGPAHVGNGGVSPDRGRCQEAAEQF